MKLRNHTYLFGISNNVVCINYTGHNTPGFLICCLMRVNQRLVEEFKMADFSGPCHQSDKLEIFVF